MVSISSGTTVYVKDADDNTVDTITPPKKLEYLFYSSKDVTPSYHFATSFGNYPLFILMEVLKIKIIIDLGKQNNKAAPKAPTVKAVIFIAQ